MLNIGPSRRALLTSAGGAIAVLSIGGTLHAAEMRTPALPSGDAYQPWKSWDDASLEGHALRARFRRSARRQSARHPAVAVPRRRQFDRGLRRHVAKFGRDGPFPEGNAPGSRLRDRKHDARRGAERLFRPMSSSRPAPSTDIVERARPVLAARLRLAKQAPKAADPLTRAIPERHTNRYAYQRSRPLDATWLDAARRLGEADGVRVIVFSKARRAIGSKPPWSTRPEPSSPTRA